LSTTLDIIAIYLQGQKILYVESKDYCEYYLHRLMLPAIFISSICSVISGIFLGNISAAMTVSFLTAINSFLLSIVTYLKLDAKAEAHKTTAYSFDQLQSLCEFTSGKVLLSNAYSNNVKDMSNNVIKYDIHYVENFITDIEIKVKEIKEKNQFIVPKSIINKYKNIYYTNIFTKVKEIQSQELVLLHKLNKLMREEKFLYNLNPQELDHKKMLELFESKMEALEVIIDFKTEFNKVKELIMKDVLTVKDSDKKAK